MSQSASTSAPAPTPASSAKFNDEGNRVALGNDVGFPGHIGSDKYYCGQTRNISGSDGRCGPTAGPQCASCRRFTSDLSASVSSSSSTSASTSSGKAKEPSEANEPSAESPKGDKPGKRPSTPFFGCAICFKFSYLGQISI